MKKRILAFDLFCAQPVGTIKFHGGGEYIKTVFRYLVENTHAIDCMVVYFDENKYIDEWITELIERYHINYENVSDPKQIYDKVSVLNEGYEVTFFCGLPYSYQKMRFPSDVKVVGVIHGLRDIEKPYDFKMFKYGFDYAFIKNLAKVVFYRLLAKKYRKSAERIVQLCDELIVDSYHTRASIQVNFPGMLRKMPYVFYPMTQMLDADCQEEEKEKYIMMISANRWIKNSYRTLVAIDEMYSNGLLADYKTFVYGNLPSAIKRKLKNKNKYVYHSYVTSQELEYAYRDCDIFMYLTLNEGFGNVPMEAMKYGKTCVVSAVCSLPEVYGDSVYFCNPYDIMEIKNRILQASSKKIDRDIIMKRLEYLNSRQIADMRKLCDVLLDER